MQKFKTQYWKKFQETKNNKQSCRLASSSSRIFGPKNVGISISTSLFLPALKSFACNSVRRQKQSRASLDSSVESEKGA